MAEFYIIRHAHAVSRLNWEKDDLIRPLTPEGKKRARKAFNKLFKILDKPKVIYTSEAKRAVDTAKILSKIAGCEFIIEPCLNPGADKLDYSTIVRDYKGKEPFAIIGHEPDISQFVSFYISDSNVNIKVRKGSICHIKNKFLENFIQQNALL